MGIPVTVALHHEVLYPWSALRRTLEAPPRVLSLDFHTDTLSCLRRGLPAPEPGAWRDDAAVAQAVRTLRHDEHFDWALCAGLVSEVFLIAVSPQNGPLPEGIRVSSMPGLSPEDVLTASDRARTFAVLADAAFPPEAAAFAAGGPYILDLDCDVFPTAAALEFAPDGVFAQLARRAALVTLSEESDWVKLLRLPGETFTGEQAAARLRTAIADLPVTPASALPRRGL